MPRLDNSNQSILSVVRVFGTPEYANIQHDPKDPGATPPVDVCTYCMGGYFRSNKEVCDHPPYNELEEDDCRCAMCGKKLEEGEDG